MLLPYTLPLDTRYEENILVEGISYVGTWGQGEARVQIVG